MSFEVSFQRLALYNQWMNTSVYQAAKKLSASELNENRGAYFGSIIGTLNHIMVGDVFWFKRFSNHPLAFSSLDYFRDIAKPESLNSTMYADLASLNKAREIMDKHIVLFTDELTDDVLSSALKYTDSKGNESVKNVGYLLQHVFNHQAHHRGQVSTLFSQCGVDVGVTDMLALIPDE
ncbi:MAG: putative damage-inducible protein DinB [Candidatus Endobugula sp.]|jgi:uncharacterized damage-inducible protein DinB